MNTYFAGLTRSSLTSLSELNPGVYVIVLTGGPCSGKTSALAFLTKELTRRGHKVFISPEVAERLFSSGADHPVDGASALALQRRILLDTISQEETMFSLANSYRFPYLTPSSISTPADPKVILLCDRGCMDGGAYVDLDDFQRIVRGLNLVQIDLSASRYHAVFHLRTAALGAEGFYQNSSVRLESVEEAKGLDDRILNAWLDHPKMKIVGNTDKSGNALTFDQKLRELLANVCDAIGDPVPLEKERKFLVKPGSFDPSLILSPRVMYTIFQDYITSSGGGEARVRKCVSERGEYHFYTEKMPVDTGKEGALTRVERQRLITEGEYCHLLVGRRPNTDQIKKTRHVFPYNDLIFEVDSFLGPKRHKGLVLVEVEVSDENTEIKFPPFFSIEDEVTHDRQYTNRVLADCRPVC